MRANKYAVYWSVGITSVSLVVALCFFGTESFLYDISLACFGSALLAIVVACTAYAAERREAMEQFWNSTLKVINQIKRIPHFELYGEQKRIGTLLNEEVKWECSEYTKSEGTYIPADTQFLKNENESTSNNEESISNQKMTLKEAKDQLVKTIDAYIAFSEVDLSEMNNAYGKLDFMFANHSVRKSAYTKLYDKIRTFNIKCKEESMHFRMLQNGEGNIKVCFDKVLSLDKMLYNTKTDNMIIEVYAYMVDDLLHDLETFRSQIYNIEPKYDTAIRVQGYRKKKNT